MRHPSTSTIGRRLTQLRAPRSQRDQASLLGVPERTYQTYEQDTRTPDLRTLLGVLAQGWDLNWVLAGVGAQRLDPRAVVEWLAVTRYGPESGVSLDEAATQIAENYGKPGFPVPDWVLAELPEISLAQAREIAAGAWHANSAREESQPVSREDLTIALQLVSEVVAKHQLPMSPEKRAELTIAVAELHAEGVPESKLLRFVLAAVA